MSFKRKASVVAIDAGFWVISLITDIVMKKLNSPGFSWVNHPCLGKQKTCQDENPLAGSAFDLPDM
jgi:hypothetical protein